MFQGAIFWIMPHCNESITIKHALFMLLFKMFGLVFCAFTCHFSCALSQKSTTILTSSHTSFDSNKLCINSIVCKTNDVRSDVELNYILYKIIYYVAISYLQKNMPSYLGKKSVLYIYISMK